MINLEEDKRHFVIGRAFDDLVSYGEDYFMDRYYIDEWLVVDELRQELLKRPEDKRFWRSNWAVLKAKLPELRRLYYRDPGDKKIRLTPWEWKIVMWMYREACRQKLTDMNGLYGKQVMVEWKYNWIPIRWCLDRLIFIDKNDKRYSPAMVDEMLLYGKMDERLKMVEELQIYAVLRDWKTSGNIDNIEYDIEETFDYILSMSFYFILVWVKYKVVSKKVMLDVLGKKEPFPYIGYMLKHDRIEWKVKELIKPWIDSLILAYKTNDRRPIDPLSGRDIDRYRMMKSPYYGHIEEAIQKDFVSPY